MSIQSQVESLALGVDARWSIQVLRDGQVVADVSSGEVLATASLGKVFLLCTVATELETGALSVDDVVSLPSSGVVGDSGLWRWMGGDSLSLEAACVLVAAVSDNNATNALMELVGLERVGAVTAALGVADSGLLDRIRDARGPEDPWAPSAGCAADYARVLDGIGSDPAWSRVRRWLALNVDLSMVASAFDLDPLAHAELQDGWFVNKTGWDAGVRADAGSFCFGESRWSYAALANYSAGADREVMRAMRGLGSVLLDSMQR